MQLTHESAARADRSEAPGEIRRRIAPRCLVEISVAASASEGVGDATVPPTSAAAVSGRPFFKWLAKHNVLPSNPASELELPRLERRLPRAVLSIAEAERVLAVPDVDDPLGLRDRAILETLYSTGMRRKELAGLRLYDFDPERGTMLIRLGKGHKDRMVPVGQRAIRWIDVYLCDARPKLVTPPDEGALFVSHTGEAMIPNRLTELVRDHVNASGVNKKGSCHLFRHTMATLMLEGGADIRFIQEMLGRAELSTTQLYTQGEAELLAVLEDEADEEEGEATS